MAGSNIADLAVAKQRTTVRNNLFVPAIVLLLTGFAVTFTQEMHDQLAFNRWIVAVFGIVYGVALAVTSKAAAETAQRPLTLALAALAVVTGIAAPFMPSTAALSMLLLVWASLTTIASVWQWVQTREGEFLTVALVAGLLAFILAFAARGLPAVMGFFAAYCIIVGVYLGIAAFDRTAKAAAPEVL